MQIVFAPFALARVSSTSVLKDARCSSVYTSVICKTIKRASCGSLARALFHDDDSCPSSGVVLMESGVPGARPPPPREATAKEATESNSKTARRKKLSSSSETGLKSLLLRLRHDRLAVGRWVLMVTGRNKKRWRVGACSATIIPFLNASRICACISLPSLDHNRKLRACRCFLQLYLPCCGSCSSKRDAPTSVMSTNADRYELHSGFQVSFICKPPADWTDSEKKFPPGTTLLYANAQ